MTVMWPEDAGDGWTYIVFVLAAFVGVLGIGAYVEQVVAPALRRWRSRRRLRRRLRDLERARLGHWIEDGNVIPRRSRW